MSLSSSLQIAGNTLSAAQIGLQVVGQNIANANTPGYIREDVSFSPAPTQQIGNLQLGLGVQVTGIVQQVDNLLEERLRGANSDQANSQIQSQTYQQLEAATNELGDNGLSKSLSDFFSSINDVLNAPQDVTVRNQAVLSGQSLASTINGLSAQTDQIRSSLDQQLGTDVDSINQLTQQISSLNQQIAQAEGGGTTSSPAVGLRDQRNVALTSLSNLINITVREQPSGAVNVYTGGEFLVFGNEVNQIQFKQTTSNGQASNQLVVPATGAVIQPSSGEVAGLLTSRDQIVGGYQAQLNNLANTLATEFNQVYSSGQGLSGYSQITSQNAVTDPAQPLDAAGLSSTPVNGSFQVQLYDSTTGLTQTTNIQVNLDGLDHDTSLNDVAAQLNAISGISASINSGKLTIKSDSTNQQIAFGDDTSGTLTALGLNTFFTGTTAGSLAVNQDVVADPSKFAASQGGVGADTTNAVSLASFGDQPLASQNGISITQLDSQVTANLTQGSAQAQAAAQGNSTFQSSLQSQSLAISGVNIDEETLNMLTFQQEYQASAKFISTINQLMGVLINL